MPTTGIRRRDVTTSADVDVLARRLAALEAEVAMLKAAEAARVQRQCVAGLRRADAALGARLLQALALALDPDTPFQSDFLSESRDVNLRFIVAGRSTKTIGRLLSRIEGVPLGGFVLVADGMVNGRRQWIVRRIVS
jgi:hypothetical protein